MPHIGSNEALDIMMGTQIPDACPDGGTCHHNCRGSCWRVANAGPLSGVFDGDSWPPEIVATHNPSPMDVQHGGNHYKTMKIQPFEMSLANDYDGAVHSILKYVHRHADKGGAEDLDKAAHIALIRATQIDKHGVRIIARSAIPMNKYIEENGIPFLEGETLRALHSWATRDPALVAPNFHHVCAHLLVDAIAELKQERYGVSDNA